MMRLICRIVVLLLSIWIPAMSASACDASIEQGRAFPPGAEYDPFSPAPTVIPFEIGIRNGSNAACEVRLAMHGVPGARFIRAHGQIEYVITTAAGMIVRNEPTHQYGVPIQLSAKGRTTVRLAVRIAPGQIVRSGPYNDRIDLDLFSASGASLDKTVGLPAQVRVQSKTQINISGIDSAFGTGIRPSSIDFGILVPGAERKVYLQLRSNVEARIRIESENKGMLVNPSLGPTATVPYSLTIDGTLVQLTGPTTLNRRPPATLDGINYDMIARVGEFGERFAGVYKDTVTFVVEPSE
jgi:hypothetical protein